MRYSSAWLQLSVCLLCLAGLLASTAPSQDIHDARRTFKAAIRNADLDQRKTGVDALVASRDARGLKDLLSATLRTTRSLEKVEKRLRAMGKAIAESTETLDKQYDKGRPISQGMMLAAQRKLTPLMKKRDGIVAEKRKMQRWRDVLLDGCASLIGGLEDGAEETAIEDLRRTLTRKRDFEERRQVVEVLSRCEGHFARDALLSFLLEAKDGVLRVAVVDALGERRDPTTIPALARALRDEVWPARVAAARALGELASIRCIPPLLDALYKAEGRFLEETIEALVAHAGVTFHDNRTLWRKWWEDEADTLEQVLEKLESTNPAQKVGGALSVGQRRFLLGARRILAADGLGELNADDVSRPDKLEAADGEALDVRREAVGRAFTGLPEDLRDRLVSRFLLRPLSQTIQPDRQARFIETLAWVRTAAVRDLLSGLAGPASIANPASGKPYSEKDRLRLRVAATHALGGQGHASVADTLGRLLREGSGHADVRLAAARSLERLHLKPCVPHLIKGLESGDPSLKAACSQALIALTRQDHGDVSGWQSWWRGQARDWTIPNKKLNPGPKAERVAGERRGGTQFYGIETRSKHVVFILDRSGSMTAQDSRGKRTKMVVAKAELTRAVNSLPDDATFNIIFYNSRWDGWRDKMAVASRANRKKATEWIKQVREVGSTNIFDSLERAFLLAGRGTHDRAYGMALDTIFFMSDGQANRGRITNPTQILEEVRQMNALKKVRIHTIGIGPNHDKALMSGLARLSGGTYVSR